jgi:hypothetical protein
LGIKAEVEVVFVILALEILNAGEVGRVVVFAGVGDELLRTAAQRTKNIEACMAILNSIAIGSDG